MKYLFAALLAATTATGASAQEVAPIDPTVGIQGLGALGATTTLSIIAGVVTVGVLIAGNDSNSSTGTN